MEATNVVAMMDIPEQNFVAEPVEAKQEVTTVTPDNEHDGGVETETTLNENNSAAVVAAVEKPSNHVPDMNIAADNQSLPLHSPFADAPSPVPETDTTTVAEGMPDGTGIAEAATIAEQSDSVSAGDREYALLGNRTTVQLHQMPSTDASRQHHLLRHSLPNEQRGHNVLYHFGVETIAEASKLIKKMSQRDLQAKFKSVYGARTFSNNNNWLRRKLFEAIGLDPSKGAVKKPGASTQRRRRPAKASPKPSGARFARRARGELGGEDNSNVAEALLALGELAGLAAEGYDLDNLVNEKNGANGSGSGGAEDADGSQDGQVPTSSLDEGMGAEGRLSWTQQAARGVPRTDTESPELARLAAPTPGIAGSTAAMELAAATAADAPADGEAADAAHVEAMQASMGAMFEYMARMQRQAMEQAMLAGAAPSSAAAAAAAGGVVPPQLALMQMQMAAMAGNPAAAQMLQAMAVAQAASASGNAVPEGYQRMMMEAVAAQQQQMQHHPQLAMMQKMMAQQQAAAIAAAQAQAVAAAQQGGSGSADDGAGPSSAALAPAPEAIAQEAQ